MVGNDADPRGLGPIMERPSERSEAGAIPIEINRTLAELLARLCVELDTEDHVGVLSRALGLLEMVQRTKRQGGRLCFINERGESSDVIA